MKKTICILVVFACVFCLCGCCLSHNWKEATCTEPKTCSKCGKTEGEPLGHDWKDVTCTEPKTCTTCGAVEGTPLGHEWGEATCTEPKICSVCGETDGEPLGHTLGKWEARDKDVIGGEEVAFCSVCGEELQSRIPPRAVTETVTVLTTEGLIMTEDEFVNYLINFLPDSYAIYKVKSDYYIGYNRATSEKSKTCIHINYGKTGSKPSYNDTIDFLSESSYPNLVEPLIKAIDPKFESTDYYTDSVGKLYLKLYYKNDGTVSVPLYTGFCTAGKTRYYHILFTTLKAALYG